MSASIASMGDLEENYAEAEVAFKSQYEMLEVLGEGTYGKVMKALCLTTGTYRALKQMKLGSGQEEGVPSTAIREIAILKELQHDNIVKLFDVFCKPGELVLVFEYCESDLKKHMKKLQCRLSPSEVKNFARQLLCGVEFCHASRIIHRDLKPQNLLIEGGSRLKIADFGLSRAFILPVPQYTHEVVTVWYRPLEILLGTKFYSVPVDLWGCGCILAEMATGAPLFPGDSEIDTAFKIFQKLGTPNEISWPGVTELPDFKATFPKWKAKGWANIRNTLPQLGASGVDLLENLMQYDPRARISARASLNHSYFA